MEESAQGQRSGYGGKRQRAGRGFYSPSSFKRSQANRQRYIKAWQGRHKRISIEKKGIRQLAKSEIFVQLQDGHGFRPTFALVRA